MAEDSTSRKGFEGLRLTLKLSYPSGDTHAEPNTPDAAATPPGATAANQAQETRPFRQPSVVAVGRKFSTRLQLLWTYRTEIGHVATATSFANVASLTALVDEISEVAAGREAKDAIAHYELVVAPASKESSQPPVKWTGPVFEAHHLKSLRDRLQYHDAALRILHETAIQQLVNAFEQLLGDLARRFIFANHKELAADQTITYRDLLAFATLDEAKRKVVDAQVLSLLKENSLDGQLKYLKEKLKSDVGSHYDGVDRFRELVLRRHSVVHAGGIATSEYLRLAKSLTKGKSLPNEGDLLPLSPRYINDAFDTTYTMGVIAVHLHGRAAAQDKDDKDAWEDVDGWLNEAAFWAIQHERYQASEKILRYASKLKASKTSLELMIAINLAQTLKWQGRPDECKAVLDKHDWGATSSIFRLCVAALLDSDDLERTLGLAIKEEELTLGDIYEWPVFRGLRKRPDFQHLVDSAFGRPCTPPTEKFPAKMLDFNHTETLRAVRAARTSTGEKDADRGGLGSGPEHPEAGGNEPRP